MSHCYINYRDRKDSENSEKIAAAPVFANPTSCYLLYNYVMVYLQT